MSEIATPPHDSTKMRLKVHLDEYDKLKSEQAQRIGLRDNLVYVMLVATAAVVHFALTKEGDPIQLLALPFACFVLGWLHAVNDEKSRAIGRYLRTELRERIHLLLGENRHCLLDWEDCVRESPSRRRRKRIQLASDLVTFVAPGFLALYLYWFPSAQVQGRLFQSEALQDFTPFVFSLTGLCTLAYLAREIVKGADIPPKHQPKIE